MNSIGHIPGHAPKTKMIAVPIKDRLSGDFKDSLLSLWMHYFPYQLGRSICTIKFIENICGGIAVFGIHKVTEMMVFYLLS